MESSPSTSCSISNDGGGVTSTSSFRLANNSSNNGTADESLLALVEALAVTNNSPSSSRKCSSAIHNSTNKKKISRGVNISHMVNFQLEPRTATSGSTNGSTNAMNTNTSTSRNLRTARGNSTRHRPATPAASHCYLHTSSNHRFLVRHDGMIKLRNMALKHHNVTLSSAAPPQQQLFFVPPWEVIDAVIVLVDARQLQQQLHQQQRCPICLEDPYQVPRIFPCGHIFCFVCILQYAQHSLYNHNAIMANPKTTTSSTTTIPCPCCSKHVSVPQDLRSVQFQSISSPTLGCSMSFRKICRFKAHPETTTTTKTTTTTSTALVAIQDKRYADNPNQADPNSIYFRTTLQDTQLALQQLTWEAQTLQSMQQPTTNVSADSELQHYLQMAQHLIQLDIHNLLQQQQQQQQPNHEDNDTPHLSLSSNLDTIDQTSCSNNNNKKTNVQQTFYQASDGQVCFLCGFTMRCLLHEYNSSHDALPNVIEGRIVAIETVQIDATVRKRYSFLQQYPDLMEVQLVELQLSPGILSKSTKQYFSKEFMKRKNTRDRQQREIDRQQEQQNNDKQLLQQLQQSSIGSFYDNHISELTSLSPSAVASPLSEEFGPSLVPTLATTTGTNVTSATTVQLEPHHIMYDRYTTFKAVLTTGGVWPELTTTATTTTTTASSPTSTSMAAKIHNKVQVSASSTTSNNIATPKDDTKDTARKRKVVLFSTGGHRGYR